MAEPEQPPEAIQTSLKRAVAALRDSGVPFLLGGSLAAWARGGPESRHDLDFIVKPDDAESALEVLSTAGMRPERPPEEWLFKAWDGDVPIDLIFEPRGLEVTDDVLRRGEQLHVLGITIPVMSIEDVLTTKLLALSEHSLDYTGLLEIARALREQIDWSSLRRRTAGHPYSAAFFTLVDELGVLSAGAAQRGAEVRVLTQSRDARSG
jgi:hypothetical protein